MDTYEGWRTTSRESPHGSPSAGSLEATRGPDRRVKLLELTRAGLDLREAVQQQVADRSPAMTRLNETERRALVRLLDKLKAPDPRVP
jgi:DNA-binding MarR family transcriptional regulator